MDEMQKLIAVILLAVGTVIGGCTPPPPATTYAEAVDRAYECNIAASRIGAECPWPRREQYDR